MLSGSILLSKKYPKSVNQSFIIQRLDGFLFHNNSKNLDPSFKMDLDFWDCFGPCKMELEFWDCFGSCKMELEFLDCFGSCCKMELGFWDCF